MESLSRIIEIVNKHSSFYILTHMYPDGDALGSAFALCLALQKIGKNAKVIYLEPAPGKYEFLTKYPDNQNFTPDCILSVDLANTNLLDEEFKGYSTKIDACIDHHISNTKYASYNYVDPHAASTCEIIYDLLEQSGINIDNKIAECLYTGIASDTGCFKYSNTTASTHYITSKLMEKNINSAQINENLFIIKSKPQLEIEKTIYQNMEYFFGGKMAVTFITLDAINKVKISENDLGGISSIPIAIEGVKIGVLIREKSPGPYKVSVRTRAKINANDFCALFGGGGHSQAGGFKISGTINDIKNCIINQAKTQLGW